MEYLVQVKDRLVLLRILCTVAQDFLLKLYLVTIFSSKTVIGIAVVSAITAIGKSVENKKLY